MSPIMIVNIQILAHLSEKLTFFGRGYFLLSDGSSSSVLLSVNLSEKWFSFFFLPMKKPITIFYKTWERSSFGKRNLSLFKKINRVFFLWRVNHNTTITFWKKRNENEHKEPLCTGQLHVFKWRLVSFSNGLYYQNRKNYHW